MRNRDAFVSAGFSTVVATDLPTVATAVDDAHRSRRRVAVIAMSRGTMLLAAALRRNVIPTGTEADSPGLFGDLDH